MTEVHAGRLRLALGRDSVTVTMAGYIDEDDPTAVLTVREARELHRRLGDLLEREAGSRDTEAPLQPRVRTRTRRRVEPPHTEGEAS